MLLSSAESPAGFAPFLEEETRAEGAYARLMAGRDADAPEHFDLHVLASILALAIEEGAGLAAGAGLSPGESAELAARFFPHSAAWLAALAKGAVAGEGVTRGEDEACLRDLLATCASEHSRLQALLAAMIARLAQSPNHLWQDLGLRHRGELSRLMMRHFRLLAARNTADMKWKKFLYRMICRDAGYALCTAPSCAECCDFETCFGDENGESRLARVRRASERDAAAEH